ncbi:molybdenum cofactor biosynthesis protein C [Candidatus Magnetoovum chiemensis]|nr:molybdenum cofactor biosynthesis protein C [Candidatus Magnetoovum chiemensis]
MDSEMSNKLTHFDENGQARMVDVSEKGVTLREAAAACYVEMRSETLRLIKDKNIQKGDVLTVAQIAGIMAAKKTPDLIPLCHPINITSVKVEFEIDEKSSQVFITSRVRTTGSTGVEMEALSSVSVAALTIYDMCKAVDREMVIKDIRLIEKSGGKSGVFKRQSEQKR